MHVTLNDGDRTIDIRTPDTTPLADVEATALRLLQALPPRDTPHPTEDTPHPQAPTPFGFAPPTDDTALDGVSLSSDTERAEPYTESGRDEDDDLDEQALCT